MPLVGIDNIENLHSWAENIHQNKKYNRSMQQTEAYLKN
jgi:hypothetical protein